MGRTGNVLTVSEIAGDAPVIEAMPGFQYKPEYSMTVEAMKEARGPVNVMLKFRRAAEERVVRVGDSFIICTPCARRWGEC